MKKLTSLFSSYKPFSNDLEIFRTGIKLLDTYITGIPRGKFSLIVGLEGSGKTTLLLQFGLSFLRDVKDGVILLFDSEHAISEERLTSLGYTKEDIERIYIPDMEIFTIESMFNTLEKEIQKIRMNTDVPILIIWDSIAQTPPDAEVNGKVGESEMGLRARLLSQMFRKYTSLFSSADITLVAVNQLRYKINVSPFEDPYVCPGGKAPEYACWLWLDLRRSKDFDYFTNYRIVNVKLRKNKFSPPNKFTLVLDPLTGFSDIWSAFNWLLENKNIKDLKRNNFSLDLEDLKIEKFSLKEWTDIYNKNSEKIFKYISKELSLSAQKESINEEETS